MSKKTKGKVIQFKQPETIKIIEPVLVNRQEFNSMNSYIDKEADFMGKVSPPLSNKRIL